MSKRKISYIIGGICIAVCVAMAGIWFLNRNKVKDDAVTVDIRTDTVSAGENEESSWNTDVHGIAKACKGLLRCAVRQNVIMAMCSVMPFF